MSEEDQLRAMLKTLTPPPYNGPLRKWVVFRCLLGANLGMTSEEFRQYVRLDAKLRRLLHIPMPPDDGSHDGYYRTLNGWL